jgi:hypothetical protein
MVELLRGEFFQDGMMFQKNPVQVKFFRVYLMKWSQVYAMENYAQYDLLELDAST